MYPSIIEARRKRTSYPIPTIPPDTVNSINVTAYLGRWYQMYASVIPNTTFERNGYCVCADYFNSMAQNCELNSNIAFTLINSMR
jgi:lipocalin